MKKYFFLLLFFLFSPSLGAAPQWRLIHQLKINFDVYHPQGLIKLGDRFFLSAVEVKNKKKGEGVGHVMEFDREGNLVRQITLGEGAAYHPGGIDFDGESLWVPVGEYRPKGQSILYKIDIRTFQAREAFRVSDHVGAVVCNRELKTIIGMTWDSASFYEWTPQGQFLRKVKNENRYIGFQDCKYIQGPAMICSGVKGNAQGGLVLVDLIDFESQDVLRLIPRTRKKILMTRNPMAIEAYGDRYRYYFLPEDHQGILYTYEIF